MGLESSWFCLCGRKPQAGSRSRLLDEGFQAEESDRVREKGRLLLTKKSPARGWHVEQQRVRSKATVAVVTQRTKSLWSLCQYQCLKEFSGVPLKEERSSTVISLKCVPPLKHLLSFDAIAMTAAQM